MLSARAFSLRQQSRLAISLSWIGGFTNIIALLALGAVVSHVTGNATLLGKGIGDRSLHECLFYGTLIATFLCGAALSAITTETARRREWHSKYILPIAIEAALLALIAIDLWRHPIEHGQVAFGLACVASLAMGLQNATITSISGSVVRTTHLTGIFTDLGIEGVQYLFWFWERLRGRSVQRARRLMRISRRHPNAERVLLLASIAGSFGFGVVAGYACHVWFTGGELFVPVAFLLWIIYVDVRSPIAEIREVNKLDDPELSPHIADQPTHEIVFYRATCEHGKLAHRAPNFQQWIDHVPEACRVVVLSISPQTQFDTNASLDLEAAVRRLRTADCTLVISGITRQQFKALDALGVARMMDINNLCPDLEFAIARALSLAGSKHRPVAPASSHAA